MSTIPPPPPPAPDPPGPNRRVRAAVVAGVGVTTVLVIGSYLSTPDDDPAPGGPLGDAIGDALDVAEDTGAAVADKADPPPSTTIDWADDDVAEQIAVEAVRLTLEGSGDPVLAAGIAGVSDAEIVEVGGSVCFIASTHADGDAYGFVSAVQVMNAGTGLSDESAAGYVGALLGAFCPEELDRLDVQ